MADDEIQKIAGSLTELNTIIPKTGVEFQGFLRQLTQAANSSSQASKRWTTFSRLVSGSPIWSIQNKFRAYLEILGGFETRAIANTKAQIEGNNAIIKQVQLHKDITKQVFAVRDAKQLLAKDDEKAAVALIKNTHGMEEAIKGTFAYNQALLALKTPQEAVMAGMDELLEKAMPQQKAFEQLQKRAVFEENMQTKGGRGKIKAGLSSTRRSFQRQLDNPLDRLFNAGKKFEKGVIKTGQFLGKSASLVRKGSMAAIPAIKTAFKNRPRSFPDFKEAFNKTMTVVFTPIQNGLFNIGKGGENRIKALLTLTKNSERFQKFSIKSQNIANNMVKKLRPMLGMLFNYLIMAMFVFMGLLVFLKFAKDIFGMMEHLGLMENLSEMFYLAIEMIGTFFALISSFISGDYELAFAYLMTLFDNILEFSLRALLAGLQILWGIASGVFYSLVDTISLFFTSSTFREYALKLLVKFGTIFLIAYFVKYLASQALLLIGIYALPIMIGVVVLAALYGVAKFIVDKFSFMANGGVVNTPLQVVGERGPELVSLPKGSRVHSNKDSNKMLSSGGNTINITINARDTSDAELRRIADKIGNMVNNKINRRTSSRTLG